MYVLNFGHPMSEEQKRELQESCGAEHMEYHEIAVQVDTSKPLAPQIQSIVAEATDALGGNVYNADVIIPPGFSIVAAHLVHHFPTANLAVIARDTSSPVPVYQATGELLRPVRPNGGTMYTLFARALGAEARANGQYHPVRDDLAVDLTQGDCERWVDIPQALREEILAAWYAGWRAEDLIQS